MTEEEIEILTNELCKEHEKCEICGTAVSFDDTIYWRGFSYCSTLCVDKAIRYAKERK